MLAAEVEYYSRFFQVIAVDLTGHGSSSRLDELPHDFWRVNANLSLALCAHLNLEPVHAVGTSGGAIVALNMALAARDMVRGVVADSCLGSLIRLPEAEAIALERKKSKMGPGREFWMAMHGADWESVVDADTRMLLRFARSGGLFFPDKLAGVRCPVLLTASLKDELIHDAREVLRSLALQIPEAETELFESGGHPAMLSNAERFRSRAMRFLQRRNEPE
jgi:pimeloyl-ACP methyl ester carboxylesterase